MRKEVYRLRGLITSNRVRRPGASVDEATAENLRALLYHFLGDVDLSRPLDVTKV